MLLLYSLKFIFPVGVSLHYWCGGSWDLNLCYLPQKKNCGALKKRLWDDFTISQLLVVREL